ncbi:MAG: hypothetical protein ACTJFR_03790 [Canibacter sp.]
MNNVHSEGAIEPIFGTQRLVPVKERLGEREIEVTFLGNNAQGEPTWILWNVNDPLLIGVLRQGKIGYTFEQRTSVGPLIHENLSKPRVQRMLGA